MYTKLEEWPLPEAVTDDIEIPAEPCTCACKAPALKKDGKMVAAEATTVQLSVYYDINGQPATGNK